LARNPPGISITAAFQRSTVFLDPSVTIDHSLANDSRKPDVCHDRWEWESLPL